MCKIWKHHGFVVLEEIKVRRHSYDGIGDGIEKLPKSISHHAPLLDCFTDAFCISVGIVEICVPSELNKLQILEGLCLA
jgi:hypothetical protein